MTRLTVEQQGVLFRLYLHAWEEPGCVLPDDMVFLCNASGLPEARFDVVERVLALCFKRVPDGYVPVNPTDLCAEAEHAHRTRDQRSVAGKRSVEARREAIGTAQPMSASNARSSARSGVRSVRSGAGAGAGAGADPGADAAARMATKRNNDELSGTTSAIGQRQQGRRKAIQCDECGEPAVESIGTLFFCERHDPVPRDDHGAMPEEVACAQATNNSTLPISGGRGRQEGS